MRVSQLAILLIVPACVFAQTPSPNSTHADLERLKSLLNEGTLAKVQVLHMPDSTLTRAAVSQEVLRSTANSVVNFKDHLAETFNPLFSGVSVKRENHSPDLRWGVLFCDAQDHEIGSVFVDKFGRYGYLNGQTVSFDAGLFGANLATRLHQITRIPR